MDLAIAIRIGSPQSSLNFVRKTIESIQKNIGDCRYRFIISLDPKIPQEVKDYLKEKQKESPINFEFFPEETIYWAEFINKAIKRAQDCEYFIKAHDDIELLTPNFFPTVKKILSSIREPYAWVSFTPVGYLQGHWATPTRLGFYTDFLEKDAWEKRKVFQFHRLPDGWWRGPWWKELPYLLQQRLISKILPFFQFFKYPGIKMKEEYQKLLDFPSAPVKCHAPWNTFVLIKMSVLNELGPCENWQTYNALLVDEDWGLRALKLKYSNIWIPSIKYLHLKLAIGGDRAQPQIRKDRDRVSALFTKKWGFGLEPSKMDLTWIKSHYGNTNIPWSLGRNSYDWDYPKMEGMDKLENEGSCRLHLGCGKIRLSSFTNIDIVPSPAVDKILDVSKLDYPDNSVSLIYTAHVLEHFPRAKVPLVLKEWYRVLKSDGKAIIVIPNFDRCVDWYTLRFPLAHLRYVFLRWCLGIKKIESGRKLTDNFIGDVMGGGPSKDIDYSYESYHKILFNPESFRKLAEAAGFSKILEIDLEKGDFPISEVDPKELHWSSMAFSLYK